MRGRPPRLRGAFHYEWLIISRWGRDGEFLSLSWTGHVVDSVQAPIQLMPMRTVIGVRDPGTRMRSGILFRLISELPETLTVAGRFMPSTGTIRLLGTGPRLRIRVRGHEITTPPGPALDITAVRGAWIGEFIDEPST